MIAHKKLVILFIVLFQLFQFITAQYDCYIAPNNPEDRRTDKSKLVIAQYNCEWLFMGNSSQCPANMCPWEDASQQQLHFNNILSEIRQINADILNVAEVENCDVLVMLASELEDMGYRAYLVEGTDTATGQNVGLLTRIDPIIDLQRTSATCTYPLAGSTCGSTTKSGNKSVSKHYYTKFIINGEELIMIGMHLLSQPTSAPNCVQREGQACVISNLLDQLIDPFSNQESLNIVLIGDMNDYDIDLVDSADNIPTSRVLEILRNGVNSVDSSLGVPRYVHLMNSGNFEPNITLRYSCWYDYYKNCLDNDGLDLSVIDHILISPHMAERVEQFKYVHNYPNGCDNYYSDHWPVVLQLSWPTSTEHEQSSVAYSLGSFLNYYSQLYGTENIHNMTSSQPSFLNQTIEIIYEINKYYQINKYYEDNNDDWKWIGVGIITGFLTTFSLFCGFLIGVLLVALIVVKRIKTSQTPTVNMNIGDEGL